MSQKSSLYRTVEILKYLNEGRVLCITNLANSYGVSDRTIRRDFALLKECFGDFMTKDGECYRAYEKFLLEDVLCSTELMTLANIVNLFGLASMSNHITDDTSALIKKSISVYDFKNRPFENMQNREIVKKLEHAIKFNKEIKLEYKVERGRVRRIFNPYKILFLNENFYLVGENYSKKIFEFLRVSMIEEVRESSKIFYKDKEIEKFIKTIQTPWASFDKEQIRVRLRVDKRVRKYFILKQYLPSQKVVHTFENGDIEVTYTVTNLKEIEELIVKWLPDIRIISPRNLQKMIKRVMMKKLKSLG